MEIMALADSSTEDIAYLLKILSKPEAIKILALADRGIGNSKHVIEDLKITQKTYYVRLKSLVESGLVNKVDGAYTHTPLGQIIYRSFLPAIGRICDSKDKLELMMHLDEAHIDNGMKKIIEEELKIPDFGRSMNVKVIKEYESLVIDLIDLCDEAENNILLASNFFDVRCIEATFRSIDRGVKNRIIAGKKSMASKLKQLKMVFSLSFSKSLVKAFTNKINITDLVRFTNLNYSFCVADGYNNLIIISNPFKEELVVAFLIKDKFVADKLTNIFDVIWKEADPEPGLTFLDALMSN